MDNSKKTETVRLYYAHDKHISVTLNYREEGDGCRVEGSFVEVGIANSYKIWSIQNKKWGWILEVKGGLKGRIENRSQENVGTDKEGATKCLIREILCEFVKAGTVHFNELEKVLRKNLEFSGELKDEQLRCLADGGLCEPTKKQRGLCNSMGCGG